MVMIVVEMDDIAAVFVALLHQAFCQVVVFVGVVGITGCFFLLLFRV